MVWAIIILMVGTMIIFWRKQRDEVDFSKKFFLLLIAWGVIFLVLFFGTFQDKKGWSRVQDNIFGYSRVID